MKILVPTLNSYRPLIEAVPLIPTADQPLYIPLNTSSKLLRVFRNILERWLGNVYVPRQSLKLLLESQMAFVKCMKREAKNSESQMKGIYLAKA